MSQPEADQAGKNWFRVQNIALQKKEGKDTKWKVSSEVKKIGCKKDRGQRTMRAKMYKKKKKKRNCSNGCNG